MRASDSISVIFGGVRASIPAPDFRRRLLATAIPILQVMFTQIQSIESFLIALAGFALKKIAIKDGQASATVFDHTVSLQSASRIRYGFAPNAEKVRHHLMSDLDDARGRSILYR